MVNKDDYLGAVLGWAGGKLPILDSFSHFSDDLTTKGCRNSYITDKHKRGGLAPLKGSSSSPERFRLEPFLISSFFLVSHRRTVSSHSRRQRKPHGVTLLHGTPAYCRHLNANKIDNDAALTTTVLSQLRPFRSFTSFSRA